VQTCQCLGTDMTGEIPFYGVSGAQLWQRLGRTVQDWSDRKGIRIDVDPATSGWTGVSYPGRGRVLQVRVNANSLRCYPLGVEPQERFQALEHEPSKCSKSWKKRFPSMFTLEAPEHVPLALDLVAQIRTRVAAEEPIETPPPMLMVMPST